MVSTYIVEEIVARETSGSADDGAIVRITARNQGLIAWLMARLFGGGGGIEFTVHPSHVLYDDGARHFIPAQQVSNFIFGMVVNPLWRNLAIASLAGSVVLFFSDKTMYGFFALALAMTFFYFYLRSRRLELQLIAASGIGIVFALKRAAVGGRSLSDDEINRVVDAVKQIAVGNCTGETKCD